MFVGMYVDKRSAAYRRWLSVGSGNALDKKQKQGWLFETEIRNFSHPETDCAVGVIPLSNATYSSEREAQGAGTALTEPALSHCCRPSQKMLSFWPTKALSGVY